MSMLGARDNETRSYLEFVDALRRYGAEPGADMQALWRRIVFNILISNTDDHLRSLSRTNENCALLTTKIAHIGGEIRRGFGGHPPSVAIGLGVSSYFELEPGKTQRITREVAQAVAQWRNEAAALGLTSAEMDRMASAFEHDDLKAARRGG